MVRRGFTLLELLVVMGIMGLLGTASVGGYRAMRRGMEEKGVMQNVNALISAAYQRAQIDRQPTAIFFWNETIRGNDEADENEIVVGKAVAVRRSGRFSLVRGQYLYDEFADLEQTYPKADEEDGSAQEENALYIYPMDDFSQLDQSGSTLRRSTVEGKVHRQTIALAYLSGMEGKTEESGNLETYAFKLVDQHGVTWKTGMAYGFEFAKLELPQGYIFKKDYSKSMNDPVRGAGTLAFDVGRNTGNGMLSDGSVDSIEVNVLRPGKDGNLAAQKVGDSANPTSNGN